MNRRAVTNGSTTTIYDSSVVRPGASSDDLTPDGVA